MTELRRHYPGSPIRTLWNASTRSPTWTLRRWRCPFGSQGGKVVRLPFLLVKTRALLYDRLAHLIWQYAIVVPLPPSLARRCRERQPSTQAIEREQARLARESLFDVEKVPDNTTFWNALEGRIIE